MFAYGQVLEFLRSFFFKKKKDLIKLGTRVISDFFPPELVSCVSCKQ